MVPALKGSGLLDDTQEAGRVHQVRQVLEIHVACFPWRPQITPGCVSGAWSGEAFHPRGAEGPLGGGRALQLPGFHGGGST